MSPKKSFINPYLCIIFDCLAMGLDCSFPYFGIIPWNDFVGIYAFKFCQFYHFNKNQFFSLSIYLALSTTRALFIMTSLYKMRFQLKIGSHFLCCSYSSADYQSVLAPPLIRSVCVVAFFLGSKVGILMELIVDVQHPVVLAGGGLGILSGLGDVSNIEMSEVNFSHCWRYQKRKPTREK